MCPAVSAAFAAPYIDAGRQALRDVGYAEGQNIIIPPVMAVAPIVYAYAKQEVADRGLV